MEVRRSVQGGQSAGSGVREPHLTRGISLLLLQLFYTGTRACNEHREHSMVTPHGDACLELSSLIFLLVTGTRAQTRSHKLPKTNSLLR